MPYLLFALRQNPQSPVRARHFLFLFKSWSHHRPCVGAWTCSSFQGTSHRDGRGRLRLRARRLGRYPQRLRRIYRRNRERGRGGGGGEGIQRKKSIERQKARKRLRARKRKTIDAITKQQNLGRKLGRHRLFHIQTSSLIKNVFIVPSTFHRVAEDFERPVDFLEGFVRSRLFLLGFRSPAIRVPFQSCLLVNLLDLF